MSGYTPVFRTVFEGSLFGKYPDTAAWLFILALADKHGEIDMTPEYIAGITGMPVATLLDCIQRFLSPDPRSRTPENEGRRLELLEPDKRDWGWRVLNHRQYREKARLMSKNEREVSTGENAKRVSDRRRPPQTAGSAADHPSDADSYSYSDTNKEKTPLPPKGEPVIGLDASAWDRFSTYRREIRKPFKPVSVQAAQRKLAGFGADQAAVVEQSIANGWTGLFTLNYATKPNGHDRRRDIP